jgi:hypothetical protein
MGRNERKRCGSEVVFWSPLVKTSQASQWMNYSLSNAWWMEQSHLLSGSSGSETMDNTIVKGWDQKVPLSAEYYLPYWQISPLEQNSTAIVEASLRYSVNATMFMAAMLSKSEIMTPAIAPGRSPWLEGTGPASSLIAPIFSKSNDKLSNVVGFVQSFFSWEHYLKHLVPQGVKCIYCVIQNTAGQAYTYKLQASMVSYSEE